jgi:hypothetical protein
MASPHFLKQLSASGLRISESDCATTTRREVSKGNALLDFYVPTPRHARCEKLIELVAESDVGHFALPFPRNLDFPRNMMETS